MARRLRLACSWETVMPGQMERFVCRCGKRLAAKSIIQRDALRPERWKFTGGLYMTSGGGGSEESFIYLNPWQIHGEARRDAESYATQRARAACRRGVW